MKAFILLIFSVLSLSAVGQNTWYKTYSDSTDRKDKDTIVEEWVDRQFGYDWEIFLNGDSSAVAGSTSNDISGIVRVEWTPYGLENWIALDSATVTGASFKKRFYGSTTGGNLRYYFYQLHDSVNYNLLGRFQLFKQ